jgi:hypothetical protein
VSTELQRIGLLRSALLVLACALLAFGAWSASGASVGGNPGRDVEVRAVTAHVAHAAARAPRAHSKHRTAAEPARTGAVKPRSHVCTGAGGKRYRVDSRIKCPRITAPSGKLLRRLRQHKTIVAPPRRPASTPGAGAQQPASGGASGSDTAPTSKPSPQGPAKPLGTGGTQAPSS